MSNFTRTMLGAFQKLMMVKPDKKIDFINIQILQNIIFLGKAEYSSNVSAHALRKAGVPE